MLGMANRDPPPLKTRLSRLRAFFKKKVGKKDEEVLGVLPDHLRRSRTTRVVSLLLWIGAFGFTVYQLWSLCYAFAKREPITSLTPIFKDIPLEMTLHFHLFWIDVSMAIRDFYWKHVNVTDYLKIGDKTYNNLTKANDVLLNLLDEKVENVLSYRGYCDKWIQGGSPLTELTGGTGPALEFYSPGKVFNYSHVFLEKVLGYGYDADAYLSMEYDGKPFSNVTEYEVLYYMAESLSKALTVESVLDQSSYRYEPYVTSCSIAVRFTVDDITAVDPSQQQVRSDPSQSRPALFVVKFGVLPKWVTDGFVNVAFGSGSDTCGAFSQVWLPPGETVDLNRTSRIQHTFQVHVTKYRRDRAYCNAALDKISIGQYCFLHFAENGSSCVPYLGQNVDYGNAKVCSIENRIEYARHPLSTLPEECGGQNFDNCFPTSHIQISSSNPWCQRNERAALNCSFSPTLHNVDPTPCANDVVRSVYQKKAGGKYDPELHVYRQEELSLLVETKEQFSWTWFLASFAGQLGLFMSIAGKTEVVHRIWTKLKASLRKAGLMPHQPGWLENGIGGQNSELQESPA